MMTYRHKREFVLVGTLLIVFLLGVAAAFFIGRQAGPTSHGDTQVRVDDGQYRYINPLLYSNNARSSDYDSLRVELGAYIDSAVAEHTADEVSVYFRDVNNGRWTGINENATYEPSSMLKVIIMMGTLKLAENQPSLLSERLRYSKADAGDPYYPPRDDLTTGSYTIQSLINAMIIYSDNDAMTALLGDSRIQAATQNIYQIFQFPPTTASTTDFMSAKSYATVFRTLYNSSFFQWKLSDQVLGLLTSTTFDRGLKASVPASLAVAHKFGERTFVNDDGSIHHRELHDCGIVYYPDQPYLLCVMTRGKDFSQLESTIAGISKLVYDYVDRHPSPVVK